MSLGKMKKATIVISRPGDTERSRARERFLCIFVSPGLEMNVCGVFAVFEKGYPCKLNIQLLSEDSAQQYLHTYIHRSTCRQG